MLYNFFTEPPEIRVQFIIFLPSLKSGVLILCSIVVTHASAIVFTSTEIVVSGGEQILE